MLKMQPGGRQRLPEVPFRPGRLRETRMPAGLARGHPCGPSTDDTHARMLHGQFCRILESRTYALPETVPRPKLRVTEIDLRNSWARARRRFGASGCSVHMDLCILSSGNVGFGRIFGLRPMPGLDPMCQPR